MQKKSNSILNKVIFLIIFLIYQSNALSKDMILGQLKNPKLTNQSQKWNFITDQVMGGASTGKFIVEKVDGVTCYRMTGDVTTKNNGGVLINPTTGNTRFELTKIDPVLYTQIQRLNDNEISAPLLEQDNIGTSSYKIIKVTNRFDEHVADYSKDYIKIKELALKEKQLKTIQTWMSEKIIETYISVNKDSRECNFANKWLKK